MNCVSLTLTTSAQTLREIDSKIPKEAAVLILQAPSTNSGIAYFGNSAIQPFELAAGDPLYAVPADVPGGRVNCDEFYVKGTAADKLSVSWIEVNKTEL